MIDVLYVAYNRLAYTKESFEALLANTDWSEVATLFVHDDGSYDGTADYLGERCEQWGGNRIATEVVFDDHPLGGPVAAMNWYLDHVSEGVETFAKIDNDFVVCPGWLPDMLETLRLNPGLDILGMEPFMGDVTHPPLHRTATPAEHIGGKGLIRLRTFAHCRPRPAGLRGYFGFTEFQTKHPQLTKAWVTPDLPCFGLDQLPFEPWLSLAAEYVEKGWHRHWPPYHEQATGYWDWWNEAAA